MKGRDTHMRTHTCTRAHTHTFVCMCLCVSMCVCKCNVHGVQKRATNPLKLELQAVVNHLMWELVLELRSSEKAANALSH